MNLRDKIANIIIDKANQGTWKNDGKLVADEVNVFSCADAIIKLLENENIIYEIKT